MIRIAVVDDEPRQAQRGARLIQEAFGARKIEASLNEVVFDVAIAPEKAMSDVQASIVRLRPHILICDNKVAKQEAWGQIFISKMKDILPETVMCLLTRETLKCHQFGLRRPNPDLIIDKGHLAGEPQYRDFVVDQLLAKIKLLSDIDIDWTESFEEIFAKFKDSRGKRASKEEVISLIEQCLFDGNVNRPRKRVTIDRLAGGRSGSVVLNCRISGDISYGITGVIKISRAAEARKEFENYNRFVKWVLPYTWKVEVLGTGVTESLGAICYSFAFDGDGKPNSCTDLLRIGDQKVVDAICSSIFNPASRAWYSHDRKVHLDCSEYFQRAPFFTRTSQIQEREDKLAHRFAEIFGRHFSQNEYGFKLFDCEVSKPNRLIFTDDWGFVEECISHGDLNANNILVNSNSQGMAFIDFQSTGFHNIYRDFVSLESSLRIDWADDVDASGFHELLLQELEVAEGNDIIVRGYLGQVKKIRAAAFSNFPLTNTNNRHIQHLIATFVHFSWLATRFDDWSKTAYARLLFGAFASLVMLSKKHGVEARDAVQR